MNWAGKISNWLRRTFTWYLSTKVALAILVLAVSAASITATTTNYQAEIGGALNVTNNLVGTDKGFSKAGLAIVATATCPSLLNVTFSTTPTTANNLVAPLDVVYDVQVNTTATTPKVSCFTVSLTLTPNGGSPTTFSLKIATSSSVSAGYTIDCKFDVGASLPGSPFSFKVSVQ